MHNPPMVIGIELKDWPLAGTAIVGAEPGGADGMVASRPSELGCGGGLGKANTGETTPISKTKPRLKKTDFAGIDRRIVALSLWQSRLDPNVYYVLNAGTSNGRIWAVAKSD